MNPFNFLTKISCGPEELPELGNWDLFVSCYTLSGRVNLTFSKVSAREKLWFIAEEYGFDPTTLPKGDHSVVFGKGGDEQEVMGELVKRISQIDGKVCIDATGFLRPHLLYLIRALNEKSISRFDVVYSEPDYYSNREATQFSKGAFKQTRQITSFEGCHEDPGDDVLIVGAGYDIDLIQAVVEYKSKCRLVNLVGFPSLVADMYQENLLCMDKADLTPNWSDIEFVPANDPFVTAHVLFKKVSEMVAKGVDNIYLSPLSTKPVAIGFAIFYCLWCKDGPVSVIFPYKEEYDKSTSVGISRIWRFELDFTELKSVHDFLGPLWR